jgi:hypothetical protein
MAAPFDRAPFEALLLDLATSQPYNSGYTAEFGSDERAACQADLDALFSSIPPDKLWVTRLYGEIARSALANDLTPALSASQVAVPREVTVLKGNTVGLPPACPCSSSQTNSSSSQSSSSSSSGQGGTGSGGQGGASTGADGSGSGPLCVPGQQIACACPDGAKGAQACLPDGSAFGACEGCGATGGGGAGGAGAPGAHGSCGCVVVGRSTASSAEAGSSSAPGPLGAVGSLVVFALSLLRRKKRA